MQRQVAALFVLLTPLAAAAEAADLCATDLHRLLRVTASRELVHHSIRLPPPPQLLTEDYTVAAAGAVVGTRVADDVCDLCHTSERTVFAGKGTVAALRTLQQALTDNRVGFQRSCFLANSAGSALDIFGTFDLTWYGRAGRSNPITVVQGDPGGGGSLPACSLEVVRILRALDDYLGAVDASGGACDASVQRVGSIRACRESGRAHA